MKKIRIFSLAVMAIMLAACSSNEETDQAQTVKPIAPDVSTQGIHFSASISMGKASATTRALEENGTTLTASWAKDEEIALLYDDEVVKATVTSVDATYGIANIEATLTGDPEDGTDVKIIYPYSAVKDGGIDPDLLKDQEGDLTNLAKKYDVRQSYGSKLKLTNDGKSASLEGTAELFNEYSIVKFTLPDNASSFVIRDINNDVVTSVTPASAASTFYVAMEETSNKEFFKFEIKFGSDNDLFWVFKMAQLEAGKFYQTTLFTKTDKEVPVTVYDPEGNKYITVNLPTDLCTKVTSTTTEWTTGIYLVDDNVTIDEAISVDGEAVLILSDNKTLTVTKGISGKTDTSDTPTLNIFGGLSDNDKAGELIIKKPSNSDHSRTYALNVNTLRIYGGKITVNSDQATRVGGIYSDDKTWIYEGVINVYGGPGSDESTSERGYGTKAIDGNSAVYIYGGKVTAIGGDGSKVKKRDGRFGIGTYLHVSNKGKLKKITATGGAGWDDENGIGYGVAATLYYDNTLTVKYGKNTASENELDTSKGTSTNELWKDKYRYVEITPKP